ncbi:MAG: hypothetical protein BGP24_01535 [Lysobacterales bacterium 69-70]|nr:hypothetical protein [Xanthomonadaceae bacterium]ODU36028.1 MAG: hypothetical protein ABS97_01435 [Xanthomonadaceae bacterium SCN 69-320]ODV18228.1 MAG: hypothetical protein ABT27_15005 [Xanthomonadaceae bacterium SCN 69-25]OJY99511.1 MAG: hypothetical protein BGP24_01535 [Xanthomonadales bacterium 69-70]
MPSAVSVRRHAAVVLLACACATAANAALPWQEFACNARAATDPLAFQPRKFGGTLGAAAEKAPPFVYPGRDPRNDRDDDGAAEEKPSVALRLSNGWLLGSNRGEWGGEVAYQPDDAAVHIVEEANVIDIVELPFGVVVLEGLAHLEQDRGSILLAELKGGKVGLKPLHGLPAQPRSLRLLEDGSLLITTRQGQLVLGVRGELTPVRCTP